MGQFEERASIEVDVPIADVYAMLEDVETAPEWQSGLDSIEAEERDDQGRPTLSRSTTDAGVRKITTTIRFSYEAPTAVRWTQIKGDLKSVDGAWELEDLGDGRTRITYRLAIDTGRMLGMLVRGPVEAKLRDLLVKGRPGEAAARLGQG